MNKPSPATIARYEAAVPADTRVEKRQMYGQPCAFVNDRMFMGTYEDRLIFRLGDARAAEFNHPPATLFEPMPGRVWKEYLSFPSDAMDDATLKQWARDALEVTAVLPPKAKTVKAPKTKAPKAPEPKAAKAPEVKTAKGAGAKAKAKRGA